MSFGRKLKQRKNREKPPKGRKSWKDARNQARGNINWMLDNFSPKEIMSFLVEEKFKEEKAVNPVKKRYDYLNRLDSYFSEMGERCRTEINKIEDVADSEDLSSSHKNKFSDGLKEAIHQ